MKIILTTPVILFHFFSIAQPCTNIGQTPNTALPVCGTKVFTQDFVPDCRGYRLPSPKCKDYLEDKNAYWYKFTCYQSGTLGFIVDPLIDNEDYNWQLYDITGLDPAFVYADSTLVIASNWSIEAGPTGAANEGNPISIYCNGSTPYSKMPFVLKDHEYLLMVSHASPGQSGYQLYFKDGTAVIHDTTKLKIANAELNCLGTILRIKLTRKIRCSSIASDGSDFTINTTATSVIAATGINCSSGFDTDSVELQLRGPLPLGSYIVGVKNGSDGNGLLDFCNDELPSSEKFVFAALTPGAAMFAGLQAPGCAPQILKLTLPSPVTCSSVAIDGSDFSFTGPYPALIVGATANCKGSSPVTKEILINLKTPLYNGGDFNIVLKTGTDGNTLMNECGLQTTVGSSISFTLKDTVDAHFTYAVRYGCVNDTVNLFYSPASDVTWQWSLDDGRTTTVQNPEVLYQLFTEKQIHLTATNGICSANSTQFVNLDNYLKADFSVDEDHCPDEPVAFNSLAKGNLTAHQWLFGDGTNSNVISPVHSYSPPYATKVFAVTYTVTNNLGCQKSITRPVTIYSSCNVTMSNAFTPNNDGLNDIFYPLNALKAERIDFRIYNRWGQLLFKSENWKRGWDGTFNGAPQQIGVYVWILSYNDPDKKLTKQFRGTVTLIR